MQHLEPRAQVAVKQKVLIDCLWHIGRVKPKILLPPIYGPTWHYRHRARLSVKDVPKKGDVLVGFHERHSSFICDMSSCEILPIKVSNMLPLLRDLVASLSIRKSLPQIELAVTEDCVALVLRVLEPPSEEDLDKLHKFQKDHGVVFWLQPKGPDSIYPMDADKHDALKLRHKATGIQITFKPTDFTQVNHQLNETMVSRALRLLKLERGEKVADFFCGLGNFTLPIATRVKSVIGIEGSDALVERAKQAAEENSLGEKTSFVCRNLFDWSLNDWEQLYKDFDGIDKVLIDPPREGAMALCKSLAETDNRPKLLVYVSCNPATLARDSNILVNEGGWDLLRAGVMNMFPHTAHVESIAVFVPGPKPKQKLDLIDQIEEEQITAEAEKAGPKVE